MSIKGYKVYDGYRFGSNRPELLVILDPMFTQTLQSYNHSVWENLSNLLSEPELFSECPQISGWERLIKVYDVMCGLVHIPICPGRFVKNLSDEDVWIIPYYDANISYRLCALLIKTLRLLEESPGASEVNHIESRLMENLQTLKRQFDTSINNFFFLKAASESQVPCSMLESGTWQLGYCENLRVFRSTVSERSSALALNWAKDKYKTAYLLNRMGYPGPKHYLIKDEAHLIKCMSEFGYPLVIKPRDQEQGRGVSADLRQDQDVIKAYHQALKFSKKILIEKHQEGNTHRLTVVQGELIKVAKRIPGGVIGDGKHSVHELIKIHLNSTESQRRIKRRGYATLSLDEEAIKLLQQEGLTQDDVPMAGVFVKLRRRDNINAGGTNELVGLDQVHSDNIQLAQNIARDFHLDFVGIDLIMEDIGRSWLHQGATICELNGQPQLAAFSDPDLYRKILSKQLVNNGQIPIDIYVYANDQEMKYHIQTHLMKDLTATHWTQFDGIYERGQRVSTVMKNSYLSAKAALHRKEIKHLGALLNTEDILAHGLPVPSHQVRQFICASDSLSNATISELGLDSSQVMRP